MYAIPLFTDSGILYYHTDLLSKYKLAPPMTTRLTKRLKLGIVTQRRDIIQPMLPIG